MGYYEDEIDGIYGPQTVEGVKRLQADSGLRKTGFVDRATAQALDDLLAELGEEAAAAEMTHTAAVQTVLTLTGHWTGPIDGEWTEELTAALQAFQTELGVEPTGEVDAATLAAFQQAIAALEGLLTTTTPPATTIPSTPDDDPAAGHDDPPAGHDHRASHHRPTRLRRPPIGTRDRRSGAGTHGGVQVAGDRLQAACRRYIVRSRNRLLRIEAEMATGQRRIGVNPCRDGIPSVGILRTSWLRRPLRR